jgi:hypothetical protein
LHIEVLLLLHDLPTCLRLSANADMASAAARLLPVLPARVL